MIIRIPGFIRVDVWRKATAFFFAVLLWFYVEGQLRDVETFHDVAVTLTYNPTMVQPGKDTVTVNIDLRGARRVLQRVRSSDLKVTAPIPAVQKGVDVYDLHLSPDNVTVPPGTRVSALDPAHQLIPVDRVDSKPGVPVRVRYSGKLRDGYHISKCTVVPSQLDIRGPGKLLPDVQELLTEPVPLDESLVQGFEMDVKLVSISRVVMNTDTVHVQVEIAKQTVQQTYKDLPVYVMGNASNALAAMEPLAPVTVTLQGAQSLLESIDAFAIRPFVDISVVTAPGRYRRPVHVWVSGLAAVTVESVTPSILELDVIETAGAVGVEGPGP